MSPTNPMTGPVVVLGQGAWGTALGRTLADAGAEVRFWRRGGSAAVLEGAGMVLSAVPAQATREVLADLAPALPEGVALVLTAKGLEKARGRDQAVKALDKHIARLRAEPLRKVAAPPVRAKQAPRDPTLDKAIAIAKENIASARQKLKPGQSLEAWMADRKAVIERLGLRDTAPKSWSDISRRMLKGLDDELTGYAKMRQRDVAWAAGKAKAGVPGVETAATKAARIKKYQDLRRSAASGTPGKSYETARLKWVTAAERDVAKLKARRAELVATIDAKVKGFRGGARAARGAQRADLRDEIGRLTASGKASKASVGDEIAALRAKKATIEKALAGQLKRFGDVLPLRRAQAVVKGLQDDVAQLGKLSDPETLATIEKMRAASRAGMEDMGAQAKLIRRLDGWGPSSGVSPWRLEEALRDAQTHVSQLRAAQFEKGGKALKALATGTGLVVGLATESVLMGGTAGMGARWIAGRIARSMAGRGVRKYGRKAVGAALTTSSLSAKTAVYMMTKPEIEEVADAVRGVDPADLKRDALAGYRKAGILPSVAEQLANFQTGRMVILQQAAPMALAGGASNRAKFNQLYAALSDPSNIVARAEAMEWTPADREALAAFFPKTYDLAMVEARRRLDEDKEMTWRERRYLRNAVDPGRKSRTAQFMAMLHSAQEEQEGGAKSGGTKLPSVSTPLQRLEAQSGLLGGKKA